MQYFQEGRHKVLIGVTGSIACYKALELIRLLIKRGVEVRVVMTQAAEEFISPMTFETLTGNAVITSLWEQSDLEGINHIQLAEWADAIAIIPATAETIAKIANGQADNELLATLLVSRAPLLVAPAMNTNMYTHPATQENIAKLQSRDIEIIEPKEGDLACGWNGTGCLAGIYEMNYRILRALTKQDYKGKKVVITAGPTREKIDPVRFISNISSGKMGVALAKDAYMRGAEVEIIHGPVKVKVPAGIKKTPVVSAKNMQDAVLNSYESGVDVLIMSAAVADFRPKDSYQEKIKKGDKLDKITLDGNTDIIQLVGEKRGEERVPRLVGFALETCDEEELIPLIQEKLVAKKVDLMIGNLAIDSLEKPTNHVWIIDKIGRTEEVTTTYKSRIAHKILDSVIKL